MKKTHLLPLSLLFSTAALAQQPAAIGPLLVQNSLSEIAAGGAAAQAAARSNLNISVTGVTWPTAGSLVLSPGASGNPTGLAPTINGDCAVVSNLTWTLAPCGGGSGGLTSVGLTMPSIFSVGNSPLTANGTLAVALASQAANTVFAAPNGSAGVPGFRALVGSDLPVATTAALGGVKPDGTTITVNPSGVISAAGGGGGPAAAGTLTGTTLAPNVVNTSITTVGTLTSLSVTGNVGLAGSSGRTSLDDGAAADSILFPSGTTAQRPSVALPQIRYNTTIPQYEAYNPATSTWLQVPVGVINPSSLPSATTPTTDPIVVIEGGNLAQATAGSIGGPTANQNVRSVSVTVASTNGSVIATGPTFFGTAPFAGRITKWVLVADQAGSAVIDVWKTPLASAPATSGNSITGSSKPTLTSVIQNSSTTLTGWTTTTVNADDVIYFNVVSASTITKLNVVLYITAN